jgi:hypothetical protein
MYGRKNPRIKKSMISSNAYNKKQHTEMTHPVNQTPITDGILANYCTRGELIDLARRLEKNMNMAGVLVAKMHEAAVGRVDAPIRGVIEDVEDLRIERDSLKTQLEGAEK